MLFPQTQRDNHTPFVNAFDLLNLIPALYICIVGNSHRRRDKLQLWHGLIMSGKLYFEKQSQEATVSDGHVSALLLVVTSICAG